MSACETDNIAPLDETIVFMGNDSATDYSYVMDACKRSLVEDPVNGNIYVINASIFECGALTQVHRQ